MDALNLVVLFLSAMLAGAINAVAGGGTIFSFTALSLSLPMINANATNSASLWAGSLSSAFSFRGQLRSQLREFLILLAPTVLGALTGAFVLTQTSELLFRRIVPFLILFAVSLFAFKDQIGRAFRRVSPAEHDGHISLLGFVWGVAFQFLVAFYGGYFGAGIGILMLSSFSLMGMRDIHKMNALKNPLAFVINGLAAIFLLLRGVVVIPLAILMGIGAMIGGYVSAHFSQRLDPRLIRGFVIFFGVLVSAWMFYRNWLIG
jgi:uncharacterized membrane protein YfcA